MAVLPPDLPSLPGVPSALVDYLRRFRTWSAGEFDRYAPKNEAVTQLLLYSSDQKTPSVVWRLTVNSAGALSITQEPLGAGKP